MEEVIMSVLKALTSPYFALYSMAKRFILYYEGFSYLFEKNGEQRLLDTLADENIKTVFDVGANVGRWTEIVARKFTNAQIHSFEISQKTFKSLSDKHIGNNRITLHNFGLSNEKGEFEYKDYGNNSRLSTLILDSTFHDIRATSTRVKASLETGNNFCKINHIEEIDLLKIDVEGADWAVLTGFSDLLQNGAIKVLQFEYGYANGDAKFLIKDFYKLLQSYGYVLGPLKPSGVLFMDFDYSLNNFNSGPNYVAVHKSFKSIIEKVKGKPIKGFPR